MKSGGQHLRVLLSGLCSAQPPPLTSVCPLSLYPFHIGFSPFLFLAIQGQCLYLQSTISNTPSLQYKQWCQKSFCSCFTLSPLLCFSSVQKEGEQTYKHLKHEFLLADLWDTSHCTPTYNDCTGCALKCRYVTNTINSLIEKTYTISHCLSCCTCPEYSLTFKRNDNSS